MDKNKKHIDAKEFFKLLDADKDQDLSNLDDFDKEALEGLQMLKDRSKVENVNARIDEKLEELIAADKKGNKKAGFYFLSVAASIALVIGMFFIFKKSDIQQEVAVNKETTGKDVLPATGGEIDKKLEEKNSDERITTVETKEAKPKADDAPPPPMELTVVDQEVTNGQGMLKQKNEGYVAPLEKEKDGDMKRANKAKGSFDDDVVKLDNLKVQEEQVMLEEKSKVSPSNTLASNSAGSTSYNSTPITTTGTTNGATNNSTNANKNIAFSKSNSDDDGVKGKKKEAKKDAYSYNYKSAETVPGDAKTKSTTTLTTPNVAVTSEMDNNSDNTVVVSDNVNTTRSENGSGTAETTVVDAEFVGGKTALDAYIKKNLVIPATCLEEEVIIIRFTIDELGNIGKPKILSKTGNCSDCEKEAIRFVKAMPAWVAATTKGKGFTSQKTLALSFKK